MPCLSRTFLLVFLFCSLSALPLEAFVMLTLSLSSSSCSCFLLYCQLKLSKSATFFLFQLMLFSSHLTVMFFAYPPPPPPCPTFVVVSLFAFCILSVDFVGVVTFDRGTTSKKHRSKKTALGGIISHLFVVLLFRFLCIFLGNF